MLFCYKEAWKPFSLKWNSNWFAAPVANLQISLKSGLLLFFLQFDFVELLDGRRLLVQDIRGVQGPAAMQRGLIPITTHDTGFIQYMDSGIWHLAVYNDGKETETVSFLTTATGERVLRLARDWSPRLRST